MSVAMRGVQGVLVAGLVLAAGAATATDWVAEGKKLLKGTGGGTSVAALTDSDIGAGLREALTVGTGNVVKRLGAPGGFANDPAVRIPLPKSLQTVKGALDAVGMGGVVGDLEAKMNQAAEAAIPQAKPLFVDAIKQMSIDDVKAIYQGPPDAATRYFQGKMSKPLGEKMTPIVEQSLAQVGAVKTYDAAMAKYAKLPFVPNVKSNLTKHVVNRGVDGVFHYLAAEEAAIRQQPVKRTTDLLKKVFGAK